MGTRVRFTGNKAGGPTTEPDPGWDPNQFALFDKDYWADPEGGQALWREMGGAVRDFGQNLFYDRAGGGRSLGQRIKDSWNVGMNVNRDLPVSALPNWMQWSRMAAPAQGAMVAYSALDSFMGGTAGWQPQTQAVTYQGNQGGAYQYNQPAVTQYNQAAANTSGMSNADILAQKQYAMIAARKAERLAGAPDWVKQIYNLPAQAPTQGYYQAPVYQAAPRQMYQAQGNYQPQGYNPYAGRVPDALKRGGVWEKQHNAWVQNIRRARLKVKG